MYNNTVFDCDVPDKILVITDTYNNESFITKLTSKQTIGTLRNQATVSISNTLFNNIQIYYPCETVLNNDDFYITIGHKISTYANNKKFKLIECTIRHGENSFNVKFESTALLMAIKESTAINGEIKEKMRLGLYNGMIIPVTESAYNILKEGNNLSNKPKNPKTTKYIPGVVYTTEAKTVNEVYLGEVYSFIRPIHNNIGILEGFEILDNPDIEYAMCNNDILRYAFPNITITSIKDLCNLLKTGSNYGITNNSPLFLNIVSKDFRTNRVPRIATSTSIDATDNSDHLEDVINASKNWILSNPIKDTLAYRCGLFFKIIGFTAHKDNKLNINNDEMEFMLNNLYNDLYIKVNGNKLTGRRSRPKNH